MATWKQLTKEEARAFDCAGWATCVEEEPRPFAEVLANSAAGERLYATQHPEVPKPEVLAEEMMDVIWRRVVELAEAAEADPLAFLCEHEEYDGYYENASWCLSYRENKPVRKFVKLLQPAADWLLAEFSSNAENVWVESGEFYVVSTEDLEQEAL